MENTDDTGDSFASRLAALVNRQSEKCPICRNHVEYLVERDGDVYALPCNCKLWKGRIPSSWWDTLPPEK
jgi:hypothetical protein